LCVARYNSHVAIFLGTTVTAGTRVLCDFVNLFLVAAATHRAATTPIHPTTCAVNALVGVAIDVSSFLVFVRTGVTTGTRIF
jgi:hypothetical protein